ncbi:protein C19orf12 homolog [Uloborus diversus]|uniref:protein C19orf12 homolog n=1 Tax=Uloborus diversus TaxID=327109 RepID=UPI002409EADD|nr:protein C19orf12 homolog [Uloborus diversus]
MFGRRVELPGSFITVLNRAMPVNTSEIIDLLCTVAEEERLKVTLSESLKGGLLTGGAAVVGGLALGPIGLAIGGTLGGCAAAVLARNKFLPAAHVIATLQPEKRDRLVQKVKIIMDGIDVTDVAYFAAMISGNAALRNKVVFALIDYLRTEMCMAIVDH